MDNKQIELLNELAKPLVKYLNDNHHPHTKIILECDGFELVEGIVSRKITEFIKD